jgi:hypothetical protein
MGQDSKMESLPMTTRRRVITQKTTDYINIAAEARNQRVIINFGPKTVPVSPPPFLRTQAFNTLYISLLQYGKMNKGEKTVISV